MTYIYPQGKSFVKKSSRQTKMFQHLKPRF